MNRAYDDMLTIASVEVENFVKGNFDDEGFNSGGLQKWASVKDAKKKTKILYKSGDLQDLLEFKPVAGGVLMTSPTKYAKIHNKGGRAGRNQSVYIQARKYIGKSVKLNQMLASAFTLYLNRKLKH